MREPQKNLWLISSLCCSAEKWVENIMLSHIVIIIVTSSPLAAAKHSSNLSASLYSHQKSKARIIVILERSICWCSRGWCIFAGYIVALSSSSSLCRSPIPILHIFAIILPVLSTAADVLLLKRASSLNEQRLQVFCYVHYTPFLHWTLKRCVAFTMIGRKISVKNVLFE